MARNYKPSIALPGICHEDDKKWIESILIPLTEPHRAKARESYSDIYYATRESETVEHKKDNKARREANIRLRTFQKACLELYSKNAINSRQEFAQQSRDNSNFSW